MFPILPDRRALENALRSLGYSRRDKPGPENSVLVVLLGVQSFDTHFGLPRPRLSTRRKWYFNKHHFKYTSSASKSLLEVVDRAIAFH